MPPVADELCVFAVKRGKVSVRFDVFYWQPEFRLLDQKLDECKYDVLPLEHLILEKCGVKDGPGGWLINKSEYVESGIPMLRGVNVLAGQIDLSNVVYITEEKHMQLATSEALPGDILLTMRGTFGRAAILPDSIPKANMNAALCRVRLEDSSLSEYIMWYLNSQITYKQFKRHGTKAVQDDLNLGYIKALRVIVPDKDTQNRIVSKLVKAGEDCCEEKRQAEELLSDFEARVYREYQFQSSSTEKLCFAVRLKNLDGVIDTKRYASKGNLVHNSTISDCCEIVSEKVNASQFEKQIVDWIRIDDLTNQPLDIEEVRTQPANEIEGSFFRVYENDILVARLGPTILNQKIVMVRSVKRITIASSEFLVLRCKDGYHPEAVMAVLKTVYYRDLMYSQARGSTPSRYRLNREDMLKLPFPDVREKQDQIASEAAKLREQVKKMRMQAEEKWKAAKEQFERELLGE